MINYCSSQFLVQVCNVSRGSVWYLKAKTPFLRRSMGGQGSNMAATSSSDSMPLTTSQQASFLPKRMSGLSISGCCHNLPPVTQYVQRRDQKKFLILYALIITSYYIPEDTVLRDFGYKAPRYVICQCCDAELGVLLLADYRSSGSPNQDALATLYGSSGRFNPSSSLASTTSLPQGTNQMYLEQLALANRSGKRN